MVDAYTDDPLRERGGPDWSVWMSALAVQSPELSRGLECLRALQVCLHPSDGAAPNLKRARQAVMKYVGQARCPSSSACDKLASRCALLQSLLQTEANADQQAEPHMLELLAPAIQKLLAMCEGADDRGAVLLRAVRGLVRQWLEAVGRSTLGAVERAYLIYPVAMSDQVGSVDAQWWWSQLAQCDRLTVIGQAQAEVAEMDMTQPSVTVNWKSFDRRWRRLRLKALLEHLGDTSVLAELLRRSAVDDFEAAQAIGAMVKAGRVREAIAQAEQWGRSLPRSPVLAQALFELYIADGWDEEAIALAKAHFELDPNPVWLERLAAMTNPQAQALAEQFRQLGAVR